MEKISLHNNWLKKGSDESETDYNKRIAEWEQKESYKQGVKCAAYDEIISILKGEIECEKQRQKNIPNRNTDQATGYQLALEYILLRAENMQELHKVVMEAPFDYEIVWGGNDNYKLTKRSIK